MKKTLIKISFLLLIAIAIIPIKCAMAAENIIPTANNNLAVSLRSKSKLVATSAGYMRVYYDGNKICIEYYDNNFNITSKKTVTMELDTWGGFYAGKNAYYVVEGKSNTEENDKAEVIRVIKYDTNWKKLGNAKITSNPSLFGGEVRYPFDYGCVEMTEINGKLYIVTAHQGYVDESVGQGHQGFLLIEVDESTMTGKIVKSDLWHSFAQYIKDKDSNLYILEQSEGSRYTKLSKYNKDNYKGTSIPVLEYGGSRTSTWAVACYASVDDMALATKNVLCLGTSIDQSKYDSVSATMSHNIYLTVTPMDNFTKDATQIKWLTNYKDDGKSFLGTKITKINDNRFMVSWEEYNTSQTAELGDTLSESILHYIFIDGNGNKIGKEYTAKAPISDCHPIVKDSKVVYYASNENMVNFYYIDVNTGAFSKKAYRVAGDNVTWNVKNGVLTLSGTGTITTKTEAKHRGPISSTARSYSYSSGDNAWKPVRDQVEKIVIDKGITSIPENAFNYFDKLKEVEIKNGVKSIGKQAFYSCNNLSKITIPQSVNTIGEDILWTGYYWRGSNEHVVRATIYTNDGSYAVNYAKQNKISYKFDLANTNIDKISNQIYTGKEIKPNAVVKDGNKTLTNGSDYTVTYTNNKEIGKATITITGKGDYAGTKTISFNIIPQKVTNVEAKKQKQNELVLQWTKINGNVKGYKIYKYNETNKQWEFVGKTSKDKYKITGLTTATTYKFRIRAYKIVDGIQYFGPYTEQINTSTATNSPNLKKITTQNKSVTLKWNKIAGADGYAIYMSNKKDTGYTRIKTIASGQTISYVKSKLNKNQAYYFIVKAFKTVDGKRVYSACSNIRGKIVK